MDTMIFGHFCTGCRTNHHMWHSITTGSQYYNCSSRNRWTIVRAKNTSQCSFIFWHRNTWRASSFSLSSSRFIILISLTSSITSSWWPPVPRKIFLLIATQQQYIHSLRKFNTEINNSFNKLIQYLSTSPIFKHFLLTNDHHL